MISETANPFHPASPLHLLIASEILGHQKENEIRKSPDEELSQSRQTYDYGGSSSSYDSGGSSSSGE